jgi:hypothetical protein
VGNGTAIYIKCSFQFLFLFRLHSFWVSLQSLVCVCMRLCVWCVYVCACVCMCVWCMCVCMHVCMWCVCVCLHVCVCVCVHIWKPSFHLFIK